MSTKPREIHQGWAFHVESYKLSSTEITSSVCELILGSPYPYLENTLSIMVAKIVVSETNAKKFHVISCSLMMPLCREQAMMVNLNHLIDWIEKCIKD